MSFEPPAFWHLVILVLVAGASAAVLVARIGGRLHGAWATVATVQSVALGLLLVAAALNPVLRSADNAGSHLALVLDVSLSVQRGAPTWVEVRSRVAEAVRRKLDQLAPAVRRTSTASLVLVGRGVNTPAHRLALGELPRILSRVTEGDFPPDDESDLEAGLRQAAQTLKGTRRGAVLLVSDGHQTRGDSLTAAGELSRRGVAVHVLAFGGRVPEMGLYAGDLPRQIEAGTPTWARLLLVNGSPTELPLKLGFRLADTEVVERRPALPMNGWTHLRQPLVVDEPGLAFLDLELQSPGGQGQSRRFFTYVSAPPRLLVVGDDPTWTQALPPDRFHLETAFPEELVSSFEPSSYDAVVLHEVQAQRLPRRHLWALAQAVRRARTGLFLVNGPARGGLEAPTLLMSYDGTPLEELLPVVNKPRPVRSVPPPRQIVILVDTSGSMSGWRLKKAKEIAAAIITRLRAVDKLHVIAFTGGARPVVSNLAMTPQGKEEALRLVSSLRSGGGTDPTEALAMLEGRGLRNCGLFMISDGEFAAIRSRPDCEATVFAIGKGVGNVPPVLAQLAEPFPVPDDSFQPAGVRISFFDPKPRNNRFEPGSYTPILGMDAFEGGWTLLPTPTPPLLGNAVTYAKEDAELAAVRPRPRDPILAFRDAAGGGTVGAFTTRLPASYYDSEAAAGTLAGWMERLLAHSQRHRYAFHLQDLGGSVALRLELLARAGKTPRVEGLSVGLEVAGEDQRPLRLRPDSQLAGVFTGVLPWPDPRPPTMASARLVVRERGPDALRRPQRIPLRIPPPGDFETITGDEAWSFGLNLSLLDQLTAVGGGGLTHLAGLRDEEGREDLGPQGRRSAVLLHGAGAGSRGLELRPFLLIAALVLLVAQVAVRRIAW